jgi:hypothetical protein
VNTKVYILDPTKTRKVDQKYVGPYYVVERIRNTASYRLRNSENVILERTVPTDQIKVVPNDEKEQNGVSVETTAPNSKLNRYWIMKWKQMDLKHTASNGKLYF